MRWVEDLFSRLGAILGSQFAHMLAGADVDRVKAEWAQALAGFTADEVALGVSSVRLRKFSPNLPEFLHLCRPSLEPEVAWGEAVDGLRSHERRRLFPWTHPAVFWAANEMAFEVRNGNFHQHRVRWAAVLGRQWHAQRWDPIPDPRMRAIEAPHQTEQTEPLSHAEVKAKLEQTRQFLMRRDRTPVAPAPYVPPHQSPEEVRDFERTEQMRSQP